MICTSIPQDATLVTIMGAPINQIRSETDKINLQEGSPIAPPTTGITFAHFLVSCQTWRSDLCSKRSSIDRLGLLRAQLQDTGQ